MRPLYLLLKILISYAIILFFKRTKKIDAPKQFNAQTIFVVNHASAFLDPWVIAELQRPVLFFLARGDIFKKWLHPITWSAHMIPIFRTKENGADSAEKNEEVFREVYGLLKKKKSILIFGEGYTDDVFIRSLKPLKKGPARIGFGAMEATNWELDIKIQATGINYADPNEFRSEVLLSNDEPIHLKGYKALYEENPSKAIVEVTKKVTESLQSQLTYLEDAKLTDFHNHIQSITQKGIAFKASDESIPLEKRWRYSQALAKDINKNFEKKKAAYIALKTKLSDYFDTLKQAGLRNEWIQNYDQGKKPVLILRAMVTLLLSPLFLLGAFHHLIPYIFTKRFTEKTFKRRVFWSGIKLIMGYFVLAIFNIALCLILNAYLQFANAWLLWAYIIFVVPFLGIIAYWTANYTKDTIKLANISKEQYKTLNTERKNCLTLVEETITLN